MLCYVIVLTMSAAKDRMNERDNALPYIGFGALLPSCCYMRHKSN